MKRAILLIDHGSRHTESNTVLETVAERVAARLPDHIVRFAHLELVPPSIEAGVAACVAAGATEIVALPYFLSPGQHSREDIPRHIAAAVLRHPGVTARVTAPLGLHDKLIEVVLERILG